MTTQNTLIKIEPKLIHGIMTVTTNYDEQVAETAKIGALWQRFMIEIQPNLSSRANIYAVYSHYSSDVNGEYQVLVGSDEKVHATVQQKIQSGWYRCFSARGAMPETIIRLWQEIWRFYDCHPTEKRAYQTDFEQYNAGDSVSVFIGVLNPHDK